jgi:hypothetical protein
MSRNWSCGHQAGSASIATCANARVRPPVRRHQQHTIEQVKAPLATRPTVGDLVTATRRHNPHQLAELTRFHSGRDAEITCTTP